MRLTVCVTTFNRWEQCEQTVRSIMVQNSTDFELILVDDCSSTEIPKGFFEELKISGVIYIRHETNKGLAAARNSAIHAATGEFFAFCDDDDLWPPDFVSRILAGFRDAPSDVGMVLALDDRRKQSCEDLLDGFPVLTTLIRAGFTPPVASQAYKTDLVKRIGGYRTEVSSGVDHDLWISLAQMNPRVAVAWGEPAIVGGSVSRERMTTVEHRRRAGIENSLVVWRAILCDVFGESFYEHFVKSYRRYLDYRFFIQSIQKKEFADTLKRVIAAPWLLFALVKHRWRRIMGHPSCTSFPEYKGN